MLGQPRKEAFGGLGIATLLNQDVEYITVSIDRTPEREFLFTNRDDDPIHMSLVIRLGPFTADAGGKMAAKTIDPRPNSFPADDDASLGRQVFNIGGAQANPW